jgi:hypothetical protein
LLIGQSPEPPEKRTLKSVTPAMATGVTDKFREMDDLVAMLEQWELANQRPEYNFVVRKYDIGKRGIRSACCGAAARSTRSMDLSASMMRWSRSERSRSRGYWKIKHRAKR